MPKPSRQKRSQERLLDRALQAPWEDFSAKWAELSAEPLVERLQAHMAEREDEDIAVLLVAL